MTTFTSARRLFNSALKASPRSGIPPLTMHVFACAITFATFWVRLQLFNTSFDLPIMVLFMIPITISGYVGGLWPGILSTAIAGALTKYFLISTIHSFTFSTPQNLIHWLSLLFSGILVSILIESLHRTKRRAEVSERNLRVIADHTYSWEYWRAPDGKYIWISPACKTISGHSPSEHPNPDSMMNAMIHPEDRHIWQAHMKEVDSHCPEHVEIDFRILKPTGEMVWLSHSCKPIFSAEGAFLGRRGHNHDITERKRHEDVLRVSEARIRGISESTQDAIIMMDHDGLVSFWNPAAEHMLGFASDEAIGQDLHALIAPQRYHDAFRNAFPAYRSTGEGEALGKPIDMYARRKDGKEVAVSLSLSRLDINGGRHAVGILRDFTEHMRSKEKLAEFAQELELKNLELDQALSEAQSSTLAKGEFLANMSHEIRTPMNGVIGMTELLLDTNLSGEQRRYAETILSSGQSLLCLVNDILDFSKIEARKLSLEALDFNLPLLLDDFADTLAPRAYEKGIELLCAVDPEVPALLQGDPGRLRQILNNLVGNAIKFTHAGEVVIRVSLVEEREADCMLCFSVRDTGIGIPEDKLSLLFDKFSQVDASTTRKYGGTGLGLAISKQLAEIMGGEIGVNSREGRGSEFWVTVHLGKQTAASREERFPPTLRDVRVLIVDDNATNCEILATRMSSWGMRTLERQNGLEGLQALYRALDDDDPFRLAVIDMQMPGMDGEVLGRAIKDDSRLDGTVLVMLTSLGSRGDSKRFQENGFAAYATKPVRQADLSNLLVTALAPVPSGGGQPVVTRHCARERLATFTRKWRILLVEDNITNQQVARGLLKKLGLHADAVANGHEALRALESLPYDAVLMDVHMPVMSGLEATRHIRDPGSAVRDHWIPVIALTADSMKGDRDKCLEAGMDDYLTKPVSFRALAEILDKWLPGGKPAPPPESPEKTPDDDRIAAREARP